MLAGSVDSRTEMVQHHQQSKKINSLIAGTKNLCQIPAVSNKEMFENWGSQRNSQEDAGAGVIIGIATPERRGFICRISIRRTTCGVRFARTRAIPTDPR